MTLGSAFFIALTMDSVDALPLRVTVSRTPRDPFVRTMLLLRNESIVNGSDILHVDRGAVNRLDRKVVEVGKNRRAAVQPHRILGRRKFRSSSRKDEVLKIQGVRDIDRRKLFRVEFVEIQVDDDLAVFPAKRIRDIRALNDRERGADEILCQIEDFLFLKLFAAQPKLQDRHACRIVFQNLRRECPGRHIAHLNLALRHDLRQRQIDLHVRMEIHANYRNALVRLRFDMFDADDVRCESALEIA